MLQTLEATIDEKGEVHLLEKVNITKVHRAYVTILEEEEDEKELNASALLSEASLAKDWNRPEEEEAWKYLQPDQ